MRNFLIPPIIIPVWEEISNRRKIYRELINNGKSTYQYDLKIDYKVIAFYVYPNNCKTSKERYLLVETNFDEKAISTDSDNPLVYNITLIGKVDSNAVKNDSVWIEFSDGYQIIEEETFPAIHLIHWKKIL